MRRRDSFSVCQQKVEHHLNKLQRRSQAVAISVDTRDGHETLTLQQPPRILCASTGHYPHAPSSPGACAARHCQGPVIQGQLPQENTQRASGCCNITLASVTTDSPCIPIITTVPLPPPGRSEPEPPVSHCFNPVVSGQEQKPEGDLHTEVGPKPKLNPRSCANKEEKGKFLHAASGAVD